MFTRAHAGDPLRNNLNWDLGNSSMILVSYFVNSIGNLKGLPSDITKPE